MRLALRFLLLGAALGSSACAGRTKFDQHLEAQRWAEAAHAFAADSTLQRDHDAVLRAAMLHSAPNRVTYDPALARALLDRLLQRARPANLREPALSLQALLTELERMERAAARREREYTQKLDSIANHVEQLQAQLDSVLLRLRDEEDSNNLLRRIADRLESDLREREDQLRVLRDELTRLKDIDLRTPPRTGTDSSRVSRR